MIAQMQVRAEIESLISPTPNIMVDGISRAPISAQYNTGPQQASASPPPPVGGTWSENPPYRPVDVSHGGYGHHQGARGHGQDARPSRGPEAVRPAWMTQGISIRDATPHDGPDKFHDFWQYASYYGEGAARSYYQQWSPPIGARPPPGMVIPPDSKINENDGLDAEYLATKEAWAKYERDMEEWNRLYGGGGVNSSHRPPQDDHHTSKRSRY